MIRLPRAACALALTLTIGAGRATAVATPVPREAIHYFEGRALDPSSGQLMYLESHWVYRHNGHPARLVLYRCPDHKPFARKTIDDDGHPQAPDFTLDDARTGYREGVRSEAGKRIVFVRRQSDATERTATLDTSPMPVIDAGFDAYIRSHWDQLGHNGSDTIPFLIPSRLGTLTFSVKRGTDATVEGRVARQFRLSLDSWIGFALPHIDVAYDSKTRQLLRFDGPANIRASDGDNVKAKIMFNPARDKTVPASDLKTALTEPLDGHCPIP